jgi:hypothetical protein
MWVKKPFGVTTGLELTSFRRGVGCNQPTPSSQILEEKACQEIMTEGWRG